MKDYFDFEGKQNWCQKIFVIFLHRLQNFYRSRLQWVASLLPIANTALMLFILYSIMKASTPEPDIDPVTGLDFNKDYEERLLPITLKYCFSAITIIGFSFTAGMSAVFPLQEKIGGLRHMMQLFGLNSF